MSEAIIGGTLAGVGEYFVGLVGLLELLLGTVSPVMVRMVLESQFPECLPYILVGGIPVYAQYLVVVTFGWHVVFYFTLYALSPSTPPLIVPLY
jgi:hypothetical protein